MTRSKQDNQEEAADHVGTQNIAGPMGTQVDSRDTDGHDQEDQKGLDCNARPSLLHKQGSQCDQKDTHDQGLVGVAAGEARVGEGL